MVRTTNRRRMWALALFLVAAPAGASEEWRVVERSDAPDGSYVLYVGGEEGARYPSYKVETWLGAEPEEAARSIMLVMTSQRYVRQGQKREVLHHDSRTALIYTIIDMPMMVSDRDLTLRIEHRVDEETGVHRVSWESAVEGAPAPRKRVVRIPEANGYWEFVPDGSDRCRATYVTHADLGGSIPSWVVNPMMRDQVSGDVNQLREVIRARSKEASTDEPGQGHTPPTSLR